MLVLFRLRQALLLGLAVPLLLMSSGCITCAMWRESRHDCGARAAVVALTPVTVAVDVALSPIELVAMACDDHHGGHHNQNRHRCR